MMKYKRKVPEIRFAGFEGEWECGRFKDILTSVPFSKFISDYHNKGSYPVIQQGENPIAGYVEECLFITHKFYPFFRDATAAV